MNEKLYKLKLKHLGIDTHKEHVAYMRADCHVCISEGFEALTRLRIYNSDGSKTIVASLNIVHSNLLTAGEIGLSESATQSLQAKEGDKISITHLSPIQSLEFVRAKIYGHRINEMAMNKIVSDIVDGHYSNVHLSAFVTACAGNNMNTEEIISLTKAMIISGQRMNWQNDIIVDKHCIGGLPGNRTTPIIVSIIAAFGLVMPKTSSRAITSPAGTADTMEVMTEVNLTMEKIKDVVKKEGGCVVWGGTAKLSPADDILIRVERALDIDSEGQLIASVLSKKVAAGSTHVIIDMPVGETAKLRTQEAAIKLQEEMIRVANAIGLQIKVVISDGSQPVGRGIGPALEAIDILSVLRNEKDSPQDLKLRALHLAGELLELSGKITAGTGETIAKEILESGKAYHKFISICNSQGRFSEPTYAKYKYEVKAEKDGIVEKIDNRKLAKIAKLAGAPENETAGIQYYAPIGTRVKKGQTLFTIFAEAEGQLSYAIDYLETEDHSIIFIQ